MTRKLSTPLKDPAEVAAQRRAKMLEMNSDPDFIAKRDAALTRRNADIQDRIRRGMAVRLANIERMAQPHYRAKALAALAESLNDPEANLTRSIAVAASNRKRASKEERTRIKWCVALGVEVPKWVPPDMVSEFIDTAARSDEFVACRRVREKMREAGA